MKAKPNPILSLLCLLAFTSFFTGCGETVISEDQMQIRNGLVYTVNQEQPFTGVVVKRYEDGEGWDRRYRDGIRHGRWTNWSPNGIKSEECFYKDGELDGKSTEWFENGTKSEERTYQNGGRHGRSSEWYRNGQKRSEGSYRNGKENRKWTEWFENGQKRSVGSYKGGEQDGIWTQWDENGQKRSVGSYKDGEKDGIWTQWDENGQKRLEGSYKDGIRNGKWTEWHENGQRSSEGSYKDGLQDGKWTEWYWTGQMKSETTWIAGWANDLENKMEEGRIFSSQFVSYYMNGTKRSALTENGRKLTEWYDNGQTKFLGSYKSGLPNGTHIHWSRDGQKVSEGNYKDGEKDGEWTEWTTRDGHQFPMKIFWYENGVEISKRIFSTSRYPDGSKKMEGYYKDGLQDGKWIEWYQNGGKKAEGSYASGKKDGVWSLYSYGRVSSELIYKNGELVEEKIWWRE